MVLIVNHVLKQEMRFSKQTMVLIQTICEKKTSNGFDVFNHTFKKQASNGFEL